MKIVLLDGKEFETLGVHGRSLNYQGVMRDSLIFLFDPEKVSLEDISANFTEEASRVISLIDEDGNEFLHENYTLRIELGCGYKDMVTSGGVSSEDLSQVTYVRLAQTTLYERKIQEQQEIIDTLLVTMLEG